MQTLEQLENITLYFREGTSDKVYQCAIEPAGERFVVNFAYGRRGSTLNTGTKTNVPVELDSAQRIFHKLVKEKTGKGYTPGENGTPYSHCEKQVSGILPQLLNAIEETEAQGLLEDDDYCAQEKFDGRHILIRKTEGRIEGINKKGSIVGLPETVLSDIGNLPGTFVSDGEAIGDLYYPFDLLEWNGEDLRLKPYRERLATLMNVLASAQHRQVRFVETAFTTRQKKQLGERLRQENREGMVFKRLDAPCTTGRPNRGGPQLKYKFVATLSAVVARVNQQRSVELQLLGPTGWQSCGNVTIPANHKIPPVGQIVEVRYLYAFRESGVLYQPVYLGVREDVTDTECLAAQLKFKAQDAE